MTSPPQPAFAGYGKNAIKMTRLSYRTFSVYAARLQLHPRLQPRQLDAEADNAEGGGAVVTDQPAREIDQDRRQGYLPRVPITRNGVDRL
jgi:hypothetical protein